MKDYIERRVLETAAYLISTGATVREAAKVFTVSKSTVHKDIAERLPEIDRALYNRARKVLDINLLERHIRGGDATREKYRLK